MPELTDTLDDLNHWYCCDPDLALCGIDLTDVAEMDDDEEVNCAACLDLAGKPCSPKCKWETGQ